MPRRRHTVLTGVVSLALFGEDTASEGQLEAETIVSA
jgi:hypothetical protein